MGLVYGAIAAVLLLWTAKNLLALGRNYRAARATGLPLVVCPYDPDSLVHVVFCNPLRPVLRFLLPAAVYAVFELTTYGWEFRDKSAVHDRLGPVFILVSTGLNRLVCADPALAQTILSRRKDFVHPDISIQAMGALGSNIITNNDKDWSRQRRIVAPALSERISPGVWAESAAQAGALADVLLASSASPSGGGGGSTDTIPGLKTIAINVLTRIAYGRPKPFALPSGARDPAAAISYVDAIGLVTELLVVAAFAPARLLTLPVMPLPLRALGAALVRLPGLTRDLLDRERRDMLEAGPDPAKTSNHTIMRTLVRLSDQQRDQAADGTSEEKKTDGGGGGSANKSYLTEDEIAGNLFIFTAAGFDTTANTMSYGVAMLAAYPEWQAWVQEEIDSVLGPAPTGDGDDASPLPEYETTFPKLVRCMAVMLETLRLFPPVTLISRSTPTAQLISSESFSAAGGGSFLLAGPSAAHVNTAALQTSAATWGADALEFRPTRWLRAPGGAAAGDDAGDGTASSPVLVTPPRGAFLPWSAGPRSCPGQKMSQVEFVAVVATLFRRCAVEPVPGPGQSPAQARRALLDLTQDSQPVLTLQMNRPKDVRLRWVPRAVSGSA